MDELIGRLRAYIAQREKILDGGDTVTECNGEPLTLTDLREAAAELRRVREAPVVVVDTRKGRLYFDSFADEDATRSGERYALVPVPHDSEVGRG